MFPLMRMQIVERNMCSNYRETSLMLIVRYRRIKCFKEKILIFFSVCHLFLVLLFFLCIKIEIWILVSKVKFQKFDK